MHHTLTPVQFNEIVRIVTILIAASLTLLDALVARNRSYPRQMREIYAAGTEAGVALISILTISLFLPM
jgi:hypothetical protein